MTLEKTQGGACRSIAIDFLRGVAVLMVMLAHLPFSSIGLGESAKASVYPPASISETLQHGHYGVQLFLVISGYCIHMRWARHGDPTARLSFLAFWRRRLTRLYPPYVFTLVVSLGIVIVASRFFPGSVPTTPISQLVVDTVVLLLLIQNLTDASVRVGNPPFWSLALEEQLYMLYFPLLAIRRLWGWRGALTVSTVVTLGWIALRWVVPVGWHLGWDRAGPAYWLAWALGALAAEAHVGTVVLPRWLRSWWTFVALALAATFLKPPVQALVVTISFVFLLNELIEREKAGQLTSWPVDTIAQLGKISYGVYLVHNLAFIVSKRLLMVAHIPDFAILLLRAGSGLVAGYTIFRLIESPFLRHSQRIKIPFYSTTRRVVSTDDSTLRNTTTGDAIS